MKIRTLSLAISTALLLTACGGGGGAIGSNNNITSTTGFVGDGYIQGAYVCHDSNNNLSCLDEGAANYTTTIADGSFDSNNIANYDATQNLLVEVPIGAQDNGPYVDTTAVSPRIVNSPVWFVLPAGSSNVFASPFSTLIFSVMQRDPSLTLVQAEDLVKARLGLASSSVSLFDDYLSGSTQNTNLHALAEIITSSLLENMGDLQSDLSLSQSDRFWYASQYIYRNLGNLVATLPSPIPANFDASNYDSSIRFSQVATEFASQLRRIGRRGAVINIDACTSLTTGLYAFEHWKSWSSTSDDAYGTGPESSSEVKTIKLDANNKLEQDSREYQSAGVSTVAWDTRAASTSAPEGYLIDISNLTSPRVPTDDIALFSAIKDNCQGNLASFSNFGGLLSYDLYLNAVDLEGDFILGHYPNFEVELAGNINSPAITFPANSQKITGQFYLNKDHYTMDSDDSKTQISDINGPMTSITWSSISAGDIFSFDQGRHILTINSAIAGSGTATLVDTLGTSNTNDDISTTGTWQLMGAGVNQYLQTNISMDDEVTQNLFIAGVAGALRAGEKVPLGTTLFIGNPYEDIMDDIMFNKVAHDSIINEMNNADTDVDGLPNSTDPDDDNDGVLDANDAFPLDAAEDTDTDSDGIGDNADTDADGDAVLDIDDAFPLDNTEWVDTDNDGIGNNADTDDDNDGLLDVDEITYGTNHLDIDSDNDGLGDGYEVNTSGSNPAIIDTDGDGVSDGYEINFTLTNPLLDDLVDTDGDGLDDQVEAILGTSPTDTTNAYADANLDSDGDGLSNYVEVYGIYNNFYTNPLMADTDGDSLSDYDETNPYQSNPMTADTDNDGANDNVDNYPLNPNLQ